MIALSDALDEFLQASIADGDSPNTTRWYKSMLRPMVGRWPAQPIDSINVQQMRAYVIDLRQKGTRYHNASNRPEMQGGLSLTSLRDHIVAMRGFWTWLIKEYDLEPSLNPMLKIKMPPIPKAEPKAIALDDLKKLIEACGEDLCGIRNRAILLFLCDTGCRAGGVLTLTWENLNMHKGRAKVTEKGNRTRIVPFTQYTADALRLWGENTPPNAQTVFCNLGHDLGAPLTISGLHYMLKQLKARSGVTGRINPHSFRHAFAKQYLRNGGDMGTLSQIMGHRDPNTTIQFYAQFQDDELAVLHEQYSPIRALEKIK